MSRAYYNEIDPYAAQWLRNLISAGHIAPGDVDERSIKDVRADELIGYTQCHFFAGIGVWSYALRRAGWPDDRPVWTGSCPCQPFSAAGKQKGFDDERHLWPVWFDLIRERRPSVVLGEQVASALDWLDLVSADVEASDYAFGASDLCAAGFGGAHIRQRLYFVAHANNAGPQGWNRMHECSGERALGPSRVAGRLADANGWNASAERQQHGGEQRLQPQDGSNMRQGHQRAWSGDAGGLDRPSPTNGLWRDADWLYCRDGKWRPVEPGTFPLANEAPSRVGRLRAYGNGLDAETATQFIGALLDIMP